MEKKFSYYFEKISDTYLPLLLLLLTFSGSATTLYSKLPNYCPSVLRYMFCVLLQVLVQFIVDFGQDVVLDDLFLCMGSFWTFIFSCFIPSALPLFLDEMNREYWLQLWDEQKNYTDILERSPTLLSNVLRFCNSKISG